MADVIETKTVLLAGMAGSDGLSVNRILLDSNWQPHGVGNCREAIEFLVRHRVPVVLAEPELPDGTWRDLLNSMAKLSAPPNLIVSSRLGDNRLWAEVLCLGGFDVLMTPFEAEEVLWVILDAWHNWECKKGGAHFVSSVPVILNRIVRLDDSRIGPGRNFDFVEVSV